jgi:Zn-dependent M28 family amino/carboxypeptidase
LHIALVCVAAAAGLALAALAGSKGASPVSTPSPTPVSSPSPSPSATAVVTAVATPTPSPAISNVPEFDEQLAMAQDHELAVDIGVRAAGTGGERAAADYIRDELASYGYDAQEQAFPIQIYQGYNTALQDVSSGRFFNASPMTYSAAGDVTAEAVLVSGPGEPADFPPGTQGSVALIERGTLSFQDKVANAEAAGASAVVIYNNQPGEYTATLRGESSVPAITISQEDGAILRGLMAAGAVRLRVSVSANIGEGQSQNVLAEAPGGGECRVVIGGHYDSVPAGPGANDNGSGTSVVIEMARVLAARGETDGLCIALFGSEEAGLLGSQYYVSQLTEAQRGAIRGYLNFDMLGVGDEWPVVGSDALTALAVEKAAAIGVSAYAADSPPNVGSDHASFINAGIPAVLFNCFCDPNYHTAADRYEFLQPDRLKVAGQIGLMMADALLAG